MSIIFLLFPIAVTNPQILNSHHRTIIIHYRNGQNKENRRYEEVTIARLLSLVPVNDRMHTISDILYGHYPFLQALPCCSTNNYK